jgi:NAD/NADP transhydrogenase beta subunit
MCKAMNRSIVSVLLGGFGEESPFREKINNTAENKYNNEAMI